MCSPSYGCGGVERDWTDQPLWLNWLGFLTVLIKTLHINIANFHKIIKMCNIFKRFTNGNISEKPERSLPLFMATIILTIIIISLLSYPCCNQEKCEHQHAWVFYLLGGDSPPCWGVEAGGKLGGLKCSQVPQLTWKSLPIASGSGNLTNHNVESSCRS